MTSEPQNPKMAADSDSKLHIAILPWLAFGHLQPFLELSKSLAQKGHEISFISTPKNIDLLPKSPPNLASSITFVKLSLPHVDGLPQHVEATMEIHTDQIPYLKNAYDGLEAELTQFLENSVPDLLIYDFAPHWLVPVAAKLGISRAFFCVFNAWFVGFLGSTDAMMAVSTPRTSIDDFLVPPKWVPFPTKVAYKPYEVARIFKSAMKDLSAVSDTFRVAKSIINCDAIIIRHCHEFEGDWLKLLEDLYHKPVLPLGLMPPAAHVSSSHDENDLSWDAIKSWLDDQNKGSVVYVAFGSECPLTRVELTELAHGLELSKVPFLWTLRNPNGSDPVELPEGFEGRVKGTGLVWKNWVPQLKILSHESIGGFLTHCGWNSIAEALTFGHPLIMLPFLTDQGLNARVLEDQKVGIEVPRSEWEGSYTRNSVADSVSLVMNGEDGKKFREKAKELSLIFGDRKLHDSYMHKAIESLESIVREFKVEPSGK